jgi:hypothetical protein
VTPGIPGTPGLPGEDGGAILNAANQLRLANVALTGNRAGNGGAGAFGIFVPTPGGAGGNGGAVSSSGTLTVSNSTISGNEAGDGGSAGTGAIPMPGGIGGNGGAIASTGTLAITNSTLAGNSAGAGGSNPTSIGGAGGSGGGVAAIGSTATIAGATLSGNAAGAGGSGIPSGPVGSGGGVSGTLTVRASILAANTGTSPNCSGAVTDGGGNVAFPEAGGCAGFTVADPKLDPAGLADNGGPTRTIALLAGSAAADAVPVASCLDAEGAALTTDQRGEGRPYGSACDSGAFEAQQSLATPNANTTTTTTTTPGGGDRKPEAPDTKLAGKAKRKVVTGKKRAKVKFRFTSTPTGATFECKLDRKPYRPCKSPKAYKLRPGRHTFKVRAVLNGQTDPTPATARIKVIPLD